MNESIGITGDEARHEYICRHICTQTRHIHTNRENRAKDAHQLESKVFSKRNY